jgi:hypothetical protein
VKGRGTVSGWDAWGAADDDDVRWSTGSGSSSDEPTTIRSAADPLALVTIIGLLLWTAGMVFAGWYERTVGYPPLGFADQEAAVSPTDLQEHVANVWATLEILSLPVAVLAVVLSVVACRRAGRRTAVVALVLSLIALGPGGVLAVFGALDTAFRG